MTSIVDEPAMAQVAQVCIRVGMYSVTESEKGDGSYYLWKKLSKSVAYIVNMSLGMNIF